MPARAREGASIRFRKDGVLRPYLELPHTYRSALVARIKIMCDLDISERRKPQDGKINFAQVRAPSKLELRVATIPTANGLEDVVMRLLASAKPMPLDKLGLSSPTTWRALRAPSSAPTAWCCAWAPPARGKTTTLHSALGDINTPERKIWTAEDPVEITQPGLRQVQVNPKIDWTFAKALRAFLRADPDVIMVGEIRDKETAQHGGRGLADRPPGAEHAAHQQRARTVTAPAGHGHGPVQLRRLAAGVLAQRLVRRLCPHCRTARDASPEIEELLADYLHACARATPPPPPTRAGRLAPALRPRRPAAAHTPGLPALRPHRLPRPRRLHELMWCRANMRHLIQTGARADELQRRRWPKACARCARTASRRCWPA
jgi:type II secretory ATPase GspE/PulE/Tfp pilus assembly ATPase PilB-like protein